MMHNSEKEDFNQFIKEKGLEEDQFEIISTTNPIQDTGIYDLSGTISVKNKKNNKSKVYSWGTNSSWVFEFINDYEIGYFS